VAWTGPQRAWIRASFVTRVGNGLFNSAAILYFTVVVGLSPARVGVGLTIAGLVGLVASVPAGHLADRRGPRAIVQLSLLVQTAAMIGFVFIHSVVALALIATVDRLAASANNASRGAVTARLSGAHPALFRAQVRNVNNIGVIAGTIGAGIAVAVGTRSAYAVLILGNAASFLGCALLMQRVPAYPPLPRGAHHGRLAAVRDRPFLSFAVVNGAMGLQYPTVALLLPIWIAAHTQAPRWTVPVVFAVSSLVGVALQTRIGADVRTPGQGGRALAIAGLCFLVSCPLMGVSASASASAAAVVVVVAVVVHSVGEVWHSSGEYAISFGLAPGHAQGQYQGLTALGFDAGQALGPLLLTTTVLGLGQPGWLLLGLLLAGLGALGPALTRWAARAGERPAA